MTVTELLRIATAAITIAGAAYLWHEQRHQTGHRPIAVYAAAIATISAGFRLMVALYDHWPAVVQDVLRAGDISASIVMLTMLALVLSVRGMR